MTSGERRAVKSTRRPVTRAATAERRAPAPKNTAGATPEPPGWTEAGHLPEETQDEAAASASSDSDPLRLYLRRMSVTSLLTREGEIEISKRFEEGKRRALRAVLGSRLAVLEMVQIGARLKKGTFLAKDLICDEEDADFDEQAQAAQAIEIIDRVRRSDRASGKILDKLMVTGPHLPYFPIDELIRVIFPNFDDLLRVEVIGVFGKAGAGGVLDALVHG